MQQIIEKNRSDSEDIIDLSYYLIVLKKNWLKIFFFAFMVTILAILVVLQITPKYTATATLLIEAQEKKAVSIQEVIGIDSTKKEYFQTQFEILKSNQIAERVINKLHMAELDEFNPSLSKEKSFWGVIKNNSLISSLLRNKESEKTKQEKQEFVRQSILSEFQKNLKITPLRNTQLVKISFTSRDPKLAAKVANAVGYAYIEENLDARLSVTKYAASWISSRLIQLRKQLSDSEQALSNYLVKEKLIDDSGIDALASQELSNLTKRLSDVRDHRIEIESAYEALRSTNAHDIASISAIPAISSHPQVVAIRAAELNAQNEVKELSKRYGPKHDKMIAANAKLKAVEEQAASTTRQLISGFGKELQALRKQEKLLQIAIDKRREQFQSLTVKRSRYDALKREVETNREILNVFLTRQKETKATEDFNSTNARFTDEAMVPQKASAPKKGMIVVLAFIASLALGVVVAFLIDGMKNTIESAKSFEDKFGLIPLGDVPIVKGQKFKKKPLDKSVLFDEKEVSFSESIRSIRTSLQLNGNRDKLLAITSSMPSEGKTTIAINISMAFAKLENTLLIDCDLRKSSIAERFGLKRHHQGLTNYLVMDTELSNCLVKDEQSGLTILPAGMLSTNPQELLSSTKFTKLIESLSEQYDRIIIDTPPSLPVSDSLIIGKLTKFVLVVVKANDIKQDTVKKTFNKLIQHSIKISGVIINQVNYKAINNSDYGYGNYRTYGYNNDEKY